MTGSDSKFNHHMRIAADLDSGIVTLYDNRRYSVNSSVYDYQERGAKIDDGFALKDPEDDSSKKNLLVKAIVGAQNKRLEFTAENITTEMENLTASESVIRDADMAKAMTDYVKNNLLAQSSQAILAQANQAHSQVLNLLNGQ